jgi:hypothetical protein
MALVSCAGHAPERPDARLTCEGRLLQFERYAGEADLPPAYPAPVAAQPSLAATRVLASVDPAELSDQALLDWLARLAVAGAQRRDIQWQALGEADRRALAERGIGDRAALEDCAAAAVHALAQDAAQLRQLAVEVPDAYLPGRRVLGLYPLTSLAVRPGISRLHADTAETFASELSALPVRGELLRFRPAAAQPQREMPALTRDSLGPLPHDSAALARLLALHAPIWEIDVAGDADLPGTPRFAARAAPAVDPQYPVAYSYASVTALEGRWLLQLNYLLWFDRRPSSGPLDMLAGRLDGLLWRVTLDQDGLPLLYDSIHPCGCYHLFFPSGRLRLRADASELPEPPLLPQSAPAYRPGEPMVLRVASGTHYLQRIGYWDGAGAGERQYALRPYRELYRVSGPDGPQSLFAAHGLVPGSERAERFYLWPMGIRSPGAMRERGVQATAFLGRRHFDDADLIERLFQRPPVGDD